MAPLPPFLHATGGPVQVVSSLERLSSPSVGQPFNNLRHATLGRRRPMLGGGAAARQAPGRRVLVETQHFEHHVGRRSVGGNDSSSAGIRQSTEKHTHRHAGQEGDAIEVDDYRTRIPRRGLTQRPAEVINRHLVDGARDNQPCQHRVVRRLEMLTFHCVPQFPSAS